MDREKRLRQQKDFLIQIAYWTVWSIIIIAVLKYVGSVVLPFVIAFVIAWVLSVAVDYVTHKLHICRGVVAVFTVILFYGIVAILLYLLGSHVVGLLQGCTNQVTCFFRDTVVPVMQSIGGWIDTVVWENKSQMNVVTGRSVGEMTSKVSEKVFDEMSEAAVHIPGICMNLFLTVIATILIELEFQAICTFIVRQIPTRWMQHAIKLKKYVLGTLAGYARSYGLILFMTFMELALGLFVLRIEGAVVIAAIIAILDIFPVLGTGTILLPWAIIASASGNLTLGIGLLVMYLIITVVRNIVEPHLVGKQIGLSPIATLVSMIVGLRVLGMIGLILLPLGLALLKSLNDNGVIHIFRMESEQEDA